MDIDEMLELMDSLVDDPKYRPYLTLNDLRRASARGPAVGSVYLDTANENVYVYTGNGTWQRVATP